MLVFLHGFLGSPEDWNEVIALLPEFPCIALSYPFKIPEKAILIGYSMGGRIALQYPNPKILISTHPGLQTVAEKEDRWKKDQEWIHLLKTVPFSQFLKTWYDQPLFDSLRSHPSFPTILQRRLQNSQDWARILEKESLSKQDFYSSSNALFFHGEFDKKYASLYHTLIVPFFPIPKAGHAIHLENPEGLAKEIRKAIRINF